MCHDSLPACLAGGLVRVGTNVLAAERRYNGRRIDLAESHVKMLVVIIVPFKGGKIYGCGVIKSKITGPFWALR